MTRSNPTSSLLLLLGLTALLGLGTACGIDRDFRPGPQHLVRASALDAPAPTAPPESLLVVSYNIQYGEDVQLALQDLHRARLDRPDVLLLQEMTPAGVETIATALGLHRVYYPASVHPHHGRLFGNAVLSRWPIRDERMLVLPHPHPWSGHRRIAVACDLDVAGRPLRVVSLHLATAVLAARQRFEQARAVVDSLVADVGGPVIVGGDFNTSTDGDARNLRKFYRRAARLLPVRLPEGCTIRWVVWRVMGVGCRLDHLFLRGLAAGTAGIEDGALASDHFPIWARVGWTDLRAGSPTDAGGES
jgi:endonuclease/exonuclease/phosphatase family metal-dependent hydrolase